ncbi:hypothetical protein [Clostridium perfringens]
MRKSLKKSGLILSVALGISLIGQVAYAAQSTYAQTAISYEIRLPEQGYKTTSSVTKNNRDNYADNYVSYFGWPGSGVDWWIMNSSGKEITNVGKFYGPTPQNKPSIATYKGTNGSDYYGHEVYAKIKTNAYTWNECDVKGKIYP